MNTLPEISSVSKTYERRLSDYSKLYSDNSNCRNISQFWAEELELGIGSIKWHALWEMSEDDCRKFNVLHPMAVVVDVTDMIYDQLSALVVVQGTQEDIELPAIISVPLVELFPIKSQNLATPVIIRIADWLDQCRYFFSRLWYPWDSCEDLTISQWAEAHLKNRLKLQYDMRSGSVDVAIANHIKQLIAEAVNVEDAIERNEGTSNEDQKLELVKNIFRREEIKIELNLVEGSDLREAMFALLREKAFATALKPTTVFVIPESSPHDVAHHIELLKSEVPENEKINLISNIKMALEGVNAESTVYLASGKHLVTDLGRFAYGGKLKGVGCVDNIYLSPAQVLTSKFMFLKSEGPLTIENVTIERNEGVILTVLDKVLRLKECKLHTSNSQLARGIIIKQGCHLEMMGCELSGMGIGIFLEKNSSAFLENCYVHNCYDGLKVSDKSRLTMMSCEVSSCSGAGVVMETESKGENSSGGTNIFTSGLNASISISNSNFNKNKIDARIDRIPLFSANDSINMTEL